jgi:pyruvate dehydrogenase E1 component alpha subunit
MSATEAVSLDESVLTRLYRTMALIRIFETKAGQLYAAGQIIGGLHLSIGQEAVAVGVCDVLRTDDRITSTHRGLGHCLAKGAQPRRVMAELFGRAAGCCGGRSGSMHIVAPEVGVLGANAIVGAGMGLAIGSGFSAKYRATDTVTVTFFGEGAVGEGMFHESMNIAALWKLPVVFVCENNGYAEMSDISLHLSNHDVAEYARAYGIPALTIDGNDVVTVREAAEGAVSRARAGDGPTLIECKTYRWHGHFEGDQQRYRTKDELEEWRGRDPLLQLRHVYSFRFGNTAALDLIDHGVQDDVDNLVRWAEEQPIAAPQDLTAHVYRDESLFQLAAGTITKILED